MIRASEVTYAYPGGLPVVSELSLEVSEGALIAIIGPNGSGKSTLLKLIAGILRPDRGKVFLEGREIADYSPWELARRVSYVPQHASVDVSFSVGEVVALGRHPYQRGLGFESHRDLEAVEQALALTETTPLARRPFHDLSGGERQRVLIARAIAQDTGVLLLDEPTAALDLKHEVRVWEILERLTEQGRTVVGVTHHINLAALFSPRLLVLKGGRMVALGSPRDLLSRELMEAVYETPVHVEPASSRAPFVLPERSRSEG